MLNLSPWPLVLTTVHLWPTTQTPHSYLGSERLSGNHQLVFPQGKSVSSIQFINSNGLIVLDESFYIPDLKNQPFQEFTVVNSTQMDEFIKCEG